MNEENKAFLKEQIITYLGNKRALLAFLQKALIQAKKELKKDKISFLDMFSGSGVVARFAKAHSNFIIANDLENYSKLINECYLTNINKQKLEQISFYKQRLDHAYLQALKAKDYSKSGFISSLYAPKDETCIQKNERVFYTPQNAFFLDFMRQSISELVPLKLRHFFIAPLIYEASVHANTSGVFKGFYKDKKGLGKFGGEAENALKRIKGSMSLKEPVFSNFSCEYEVKQVDANDLAKSLDKLDIAYFDPPYNEHPYGSNYFMLNLIANYKEPSEISRVSGIPKDWQRSVYNKPKFAQQALFELMSITPAKLILLSYNNEGFVQKEEFIKDLSKLGKVELLEQSYPTFRGSRNLKNRSIHIKEQLYILKK